MTSALLEQGSGGVRATSTKLFSQGEDEAARAFVVFAAVAAIGEEALKGLGLGLCGGGYVSRVGLDVGEDAP